MNFATTKLAAGGASIALLTVLAGCGGGDSEPGPTVTVTEKVTVPAEPEPAVPSADTEDAGPETAGTSDGPGTLDPSNVKDRDLTLADAAKMDPEEGWRTDRFNIAKTSDVRGHATDIDCYGSSELEYRLENKFTKLDFSTGQANTSESSDDILKLEILGDGEQIDVKNIPFNEIESFSVDVTDVNALRINASLDDESGTCEGDVTAVIYNVRLN